MLRCSDPRYQYCGLVRKGVRVCREEAACRREFGCRQPTCPLQQSFGLKAYDERMKAFATALDLWPIGEGSQVDFP